MKYKEFGITGDKVSALGLGCMGMSTAYGTPDNEESIATLHRALELGINFWDTADIYGIGHANEKLLGRVLKGNRDKVFLATKFGFVLNEGFQNGFQPGALHIDGSPAHVKQAIEGSLQRLGTDYVDLYYLHRVDPNTPIEETVGAMADLVREGKVRCIGLSECTTDDLHRANAVHSIAAVQSEYSLLTRIVEENGILELTKELGIAFVPFAPLSRGLMSAKLKVADLGKDDFRIRIPRYQGEYLDNNQKLASEFAAFAAKKGSTAAQLAIAWVIAQGDYIIPIPGTKRRKYLEENAGVADLSLTAEDLAQIQEILDKYPVTGPRYSSNESKFLKK
jgi:aryl-alcohol dehydrogenase-like predicted oxidoreductase